MQTIRLNYSARPQFRDYHRRTQRWAALVAHRRCGKTVGSLADLIDDVLRCKRESPRGAYIAPTYTQAKDVAWEYVKAITSPIPGVAFHETELRVDFPTGGRVRLYGADNYDRLRGLYFDAVILDEYADMDPRAWSEVIRPALSDRQGRATFIGTPKGQNAFFEVCNRAEADDEWFFSRLKASETGILPPEELAAAKRDMTREQYAQEYECSFEASVVGAYYAEELDRASADGRITAVPFEPISLVKTYWDLGLDDATAIWFVQAVGREIRLIEYAEWTDTALLDVARDVVSRPYTYAEHMLPHDAEVREMTSAVSRREALASILGDHRVSVAPRTDVADGINATRVMFPRMWFDQRKCARGLEALRNYRKAFDEKRRIFHDRPHHDWSSHAADALRMLGTTFREERSASERIDMPSYGIV